MSTKLRKIRPATITTLTPSSHSPPQGALAHMSQTFTSGGSAVVNGAHSLGSNVNGAPAAYHPALPSFSAFPGLNSFAQTMTQTMNGQPLQTPTLQTPTQQSFFPQVSQTHSTGNSDLERLERLKREILEGQNPVYKAVPQPNFLESLYLGRSLQAQNSVPAHPEQVVSGATASIGSQQSAPVRSDGDVKTDDFGRPELVSQAGENRDTASGLRMPPNNNQSIRSSSFHSTESTGPPSSLGSSGRLDGTSLGRSSSMPQILLKTLQTEQRIPYPSQISAQDASNTSPNGAADSSMHDHAFSSGQQTSRPNSEKLQVLTTSGDRARHSMSSNNSVSKDPPYDPKEGLHRMGDNAYSSDDRSKRIVDAHDSKAYDTRSVRNGDKDRDHDRDREREHDKRYDYRYVNGDGYNDKRISLTLGTNPRDQRSQDLRRQDSRLSDDRVEVDIRRLAPSVSEQSIRSADDRNFRLVSSAGRPIHSSGNNESPTKPVNGSDQAHSILSSATSGAAANSQSAVTDDRLLRAPVSNTHARLPVDERSRPPPPADDRGHQPLSDDRSRHPPQTSERTTAAPGLEERIGGRAPPPLEDRIGIRIPLEERITSPPLDRLARPGPGLQERIGDRPALEDRISSRSIPSDSRGSAAGDSSRISDVRSISVQSPGTRPRPVDEKLASSPAPSSATARTLQQRVEDHASRSSSDITARPDERLQPRPSSYGTAHVREVPRVPRPPSPRLNGSISESFLREKYRGASDPRLVPAAVYRGDLDRRYTDNRRPDVEAVGHYERPVMRERDPVPVDDRVKPSLETREWRERASYPPRPSTATRPESYPPPAFPPPPPSDPRDWAPDDRSYRSSETIFDTHRSSLAPVNSERDRYLDRDVDRRASLVPRSWDRDDGLLRARPPPEVYLPDDRIDVERERYAPTDFREASRVRPRSPSPLRRSTGDGMLSDLRPVKRAREESVYFDDRRTLPYVPTEHYSHSRVASPPPTTPGSYYDTRTPYVPHDVYSERERAPDVGYYERRTADMGPPRSPPYAGRAVYSRPDLDREGSRYSMPPPPRTA